MVQVSNLLERVSAKSELCESLRDEESSSLQRPVTQDVHSEEDRVEFMTAQELIDNVTEAVHDNKKSFEEWIMEGALYHFQVRTSKIASFFESPIASVELKVCIEIYSCRFRVVEL